MAYTKSGKYYNENKGWGSFFHGKKVNHIIKKNHDKHLGMNTPLKDMPSLTPNKIVKLIEYTKEAGTVLNDDVVKEIVGKTNFKNKLAYYHTLLDYNVEEFGFDSTGKKVNLDTYDPDSNDYEYLDDEDGLNNNYNPEANYYNLLADPTSKEAQAYRDTMYGSISRQEQEVEATLGSAELDAYRMLGDQQIQLERQIADQRMRSLRSGTTSAQLAAQELQNLFSAQSAATGISQQVMQQRIGNTQQFAQQRAQVEPSLYDMVNQNRTTLANVEAQRYAAYQQLNAYSPAYEAARMSQMSKQNYAINSYLDKLFDD